MLGAIAGGMLDIGTLTILFIIGLCTHIFGFTFNEFMDVDIDKKAKILKDKPLVKGTISATGAIGFAASAIIIGYILTGYLLITQQSTAIMVIIFYSLAWLSIGIYDLTSKYVRGSDLALALWTGTLCLFGGFAVVKEPNELLYIIAGLAFLQLFIQNILAGLKDIIQDKLGKGTTTPIRMGVRHYNERLMVPTKFQLFIYGFKLIHLVLVIIPFIFIWLAINYIQVFIILLFLIFCFLLVFIMFNSTKYERNNLLRAIGLHELLSYSVVPVMFVGIIGLQAVIFLIILPVVWLAVFLQIMYGQLLPNI